jgi:hypothetical protein
MNIAFCCPHSHKVLKISQINWHLFLRVLFITLLKHYSSILKPLHTPRIYSWAHLFWIHTQTSSAGTLLINSKTSRRRRTCNLQIERRRVALNLDQMVPGAARVCPDGVHVCACVRPGDRADFANQFWLAMGCLAARTIAALANSVTLSRCWIKVRDQPVF